MATPSSFQQPENMTRIYYTKKDHTDTIGRALYALSMIMDGMKKLMSGDIIYQDIILIVLTKFISIQAILVLMFMIVEVDVIKVTLFVV